MKNRFMNEIQSEYREFMELAPVRPPSAVSERILQSVSRDLNPNAWKVFAKISLIHLSVGIVTLSLCPQFGVRVFGEGLGLMKYFLHLGTYGCMAACGAFFIGMSLLVGAFMLRPEELRKFRENQWLGLAAMILLSLGVFIMANAEILMGFAVAWFMGSFLGGWGAMELAWKLRVQRA